MAKEKEKEKEEESEDWTPDKPIPDDEDEADAQRRHRFNRRLAYLDEQANGKKKGKEGEPPKRSKMW